MSGLDSLAWTEVLLINAALASILAVLVAGVERWRPKALWLHGLWLLVILRFVAPPMVPLEILPAGWLAVDVPSEMHGVATQGVSEGPVSAAPLASQATQLDDDSETLLTGPATPASMALITFWEGSREHMLRVAGAVWLLGGLLVLAMTGRQVARLVAMAKNGECPHPGLQHMAQDLADIVGLRRMPRIRSVDDPLLASPMILSTLTGPQLLLPKALLDALSDDELSTVLVHEWAHVRRRDHWVRWPEWLALVVFWWNPVVWWARQALRRTEERCIDQWVLRLLPTRRADYARALVETMALGAGSPRHSLVLSSGIETMNTMEGRLTMILRDTSNHPNAKSSQWARWASWPVLVLALTLLPVWAPPLSAGAPGGDESPETTEQENAATIHVPEGGSVALEMHRLQRRVEAAHQGGDKDLAAALQQELNEKQGILRRDHQEKLRQTYELQERELVTEQQRLKEVLAQLQQVKEAYFDEATKRDLERQVKRLEFEGERTAQELALRQEQMALLASQREQEKALQETRREAQQRIQSMEGQEKAALQAAMEAEQRALEAKARVLEKQRHQAQMEFRAKALQAELPWRVEELRLAMENVEDEKARQELQAELERVHRELGEMLAKE